MDLGGAMNDAAYRFSRTPRASDVRAMHADWLAVGDDLTRAMSEAEGLIDPVRADDEVG